MATPAAIEALRPSPMRRLVTLGVAVVAGGVVSVATASDPGGSPVRDAEAWAALRGLAVAAYVFAGVYTWWHRPGDRFGRYLIGIGLVYGAASLSASGDALAHTFGRVMLAVFVVCLAYVLLCYPHDRLASQAERRLVEALALATAVLWLLALPLMEKLPSGGPLTDCGGESCPDDVLRLASPPQALADGLGLTISVVTAAGLLGVVAMLVGKARSPARLRRRSVVPVLGASILLATNYAAFTVLRDAGVDATRGLKVVGAAAALAIPLAMLVGQMRGRMFATRSIRELVGRVGSEPVTPARVEALLGNALGDPRLALALSEPGKTGYVDVQGRTIELPTARPDLHVTPVLRDGRIVAGLIHDAALDSDSDILEGIAAASFLLLENARLVEELRGSRARLGASAQRERLRLERNLHDGAQQRMFALQVRLRAARAEAGGGRLGHELDDIAEGVAAAVEELRELAHGLYPTVLRDRGLADGLRSAARTAAVPVRVVDRTGRRCAAPVEEAVYYCALEAIQNTAKHAGPGARVTVTLDRREADLEFSIADDGPGFEPRERTDGMGIPSMRDRIGAVGGELEIVPQAGRGTTVRGVVQGCWTMDGPAPTTDR